MTCYGHVVALESTSEVVDFTRYSSLPLHRQFAVACYFVGRREPRMVRIVTQVSHNTEHCYLFLSEMRLPMLRDSDHLEPLCDYHCESRRYASCRCLRQGIKEAP